MSCPKATVKLINGENIITNEGDDVRIIFDGTWVQVSYKDGNYTLFPREEVLAIDVSSN
jgi:hypothetical protein